MKTSTLIWIIVAIIAVLLLIWAFAGLADNADSENNQTDTIGGANQNRTNGSSTTSAGSLDSDDEVFDELERYSSQLE